MWMNFKIIINKRRYFLMLQTINLRRMFLANFPGVAVFKTSSFLNKRLESVS